MTNNIDIPKEITNQQFDRWCEKNKEFIERLIREKVKVKINSTTSLGEILYKEQSMKHFLIPTNNQSNRGWYTSTITYSNSNAAYPYNWATNRTYR